MNNPNPSPGPPSSPSLVNYMVRHDLVTMLAEARRDYDQTGTGSSRHLEQKDIAARFRHLRGTPTPPPPTSHEPA
ncbi:MAG: hypothetical protein HYV95_15060 [Opitutae bacterium]|nr:hypothetical protein [Opitutae bacterium]